MNFPRQSKYYNCGVYASRYLAFLLGKKDKYRNKTLEKIGSTTRKMGTPENGVVNILKKFGIESDIFPLTWNRLKGNLPAIISYTYLGDGHYGVALYQKLNSVLILNPWTGKVQFLKREKLKIYIKKYGPNIAIVPKGI